jgi:hypothetical protein
MNSKAMGERKCEDKQIKLCIIQTNYTHFQGRYGRL